MLQDSNITLLLAGAYCTAFQLVSLLPLCHPTASTLPPPKYYPEGHFQNPSQSVVPLCPLTAPHVTWGKSQSQSHVMAASGLLPQLSQIQNSPPPPVVVPPSDMILL